MTKRFRILHLIEDLGSGGAERLLYTNLSRLDRKQFDGLVVYLYDQNDFWNEPIRRLGYPVVCLQLRSIYDLPLGIIRLWRLLKHERVDLIHAHLYGANIIGRIIGRLRGIPVLSSLHCPDYEPILLQDNPSLTPLKLASLRLLDWLSCRFAPPVFLAVSNYVKASAVRYLGLAPERVSVIYNSVDLTAFEGPEDRRHAMRATLGITHSTPVVLCIARFNPLKGVRYLIEAVPLVTEQRPDVCFLFIGATNPEAERSFREFLERRGVADRVRLLGIQPDVRPYLQLCDIFVLPSLAEGLGIALVEAMAMERACVATRTSALPEVVADGRSGILVEPANPSALARSIIELLADPAMRKRMGLEGRKIVSELFDAEKNVLALESLYWQILHTG
ncbi:MAG: glycosyltransferase [Nitrospirae bacterium]|nr:MAG: glycosyltransferase [Nitrospirota bacterium]